MRNIILGLFILATSVVSFAQQRNFGTKTIGKWTFEKFPLHYSVTPTKSIFYKNSITGKLEQYEELNQFGQLNGLKLTMYSDGIYPSSAIYMYKGEMVYSITFFQNSKTAQTIATYNEKGHLDGYKIYRTLKSTGGYTEEIEKYIDDVLIELNGVKQAPISMTYKDSLLDGRFKFESAPYWVIEGVAEKGRLKTIKQTQEGKYFNCEITFSNDSILIKEPKQNSEGFSYETLPLKTNPIITNSKLYCKKYGNFNGYPYLFIPNNFDVRDLKALVWKRFPIPLETKANYTENLLDGDFQYRQYINSGRSYDYNGYIDVIGKAEKGKLLNISNTIVECNSGIKVSEKTIQYIFEEGKILQNNYSPELLNKPVSSKNLALEYPVLLTNSKSLGGTFYLTDTSWDHNIENPNNTLGLPYTREGHLENNKYGYAYFSPFTFDISNFLNIVTRYTPKPVE